MSNIASTSKPEKQGKPHLCSLRGDYCIPESVKEKFGLQNVLKINAGSWTNPEALVDAYFANNLVWESSSEAYFKILSDGLKKFSDGDHETAKARDYARQVSEFIKTKAVISKVKVFYGLKATEAESKRQNILAHIQGEATGAALSSLGAQKLRKRALDKVVFSIYK